MAVKLAKQPTCQWCGRDIAKAVTTYFFGQREDRPSRRDFAAKPMTRDEAQRFVNGTIISAARSGGAVNYISRIGVWDGESYESEFFCTNRCAMTFGLAAARNGWRP